MLVKTFCCFLNIDLKNLKIFISIKLIYLKMNGKNLFFHMISNFFILIFHSFHEIYRFISILQYHDYYFELKLFTFVLFYLSQILYSPHHFSKAKILPFYSKFLYHYLKLYIFSSFYCTYPFRFSRHFP